MLLSFQLWSLYYTNKRQGPFELYNSFSHLLSQRLKTLSLENLNMAHLFSSQIDLEASTRDLEIVRWINDMESLLYLYCVWINGFTYQFGLNIFFLSFNLLLMDFNSVIICKCICFSLNSYRYSLLPLC